MREALESGALVHAAAHGVMNVRNPLFSRRGGGGESITVTGTSPSQLPKGGIGLGVTIKGSGFEPGSELGFELEGTLSDQIVVRGVAFVEEGTLVATVDVGDNAEETFYDVAVRNGPRKKGVGIDLLEVVPEFVVPILEGTAIEGVDDPVVLDSSNGLVVGNDWDGCGWVYEVDTGTKTCLSVPGLREVYPVAVNTSGRIAGLGYPVGGGGGSVDEVAFVIDWPDPTPTILSLPDWDGMGAWDLNDAGDIVGSAARNEELQVRKKTYLVERKALVRWKPDLTVAVVSAIGGSSTGIYVHSVRESGGGGDTLQPLPYDTSLI